MDPNALTISTCSSYFHFHMAVAVAESDPEESAIEIDDIKDNMEEVC